MKQRSIVVFAMAAVFIVVIWWMFVFSGVKTEASDVDADIKTAETKKATVESDLSRLATLDQAQIQAEFDALSGTIATEPQLAEFIREADRIAVENGVRWVSVTPKDPAQSGSVATIGLGIEAEGEYFAVLHYLQALEGLSRLVVIDSVTITPGASTADTDAGGPPVLHATMDARMFSLSAVPSAATTQTTGS